MFSTTKSIFPKIFNSRKRFFKLEKVGEVLSKSKPKKLERELRETNVQY